jgi:beta-mannosidase
VAREVSLNGDDWKVKAFLGEDWVWRNAHKPGTRDLRWWIPASVPGSVLADVERAGEIPDPLFERNSLLVEWTANRTWVYRKAFTPPTGLEGQRAFLRFEGIDYEGQFFLNGEPLGRHASMFVPAVFEVTGRLIPGEENLLSVALEPAPPEQPQVSKTSRVRTMKSRMTYWWDFCPRIVHQGIWDDVTLELTGTTRIEDVFVGPRLEEDHSRANLTVSVGLDTATAGEHQVEVLISRDGREVARASGMVTLEAGAGTCEVVTSVNSPALWWPNGHGDQPLYEAVVRVTAPDGQVSDERAVRFGIRSFTLQPNEGAPAEALPYTFTVNDRRIQVHGWNWVPLDFRHGVPQPAKLRRLIELAKRANVNLLRIWGGGLIEKEAFYRACDEAGIMVWQEFILSSSGIANEPSSDPDYLALLESEAAGILPRRRNHPSLVLWCGGNELQDDSGRPLGSEHPALAVLKAAVERLDPDRAWLPTSSSGPEFSNTLESIARNPEGQHDVHGPWEHQGLTAHYTLYNAGTNLLHSEFGVEGMAHRRVIERHTLPESRWPATRDNPTYFHRGSWWNNEPLVQESFGSIADLGRLVQASQFLQAEGLRYALEANRRRQPRHSGSIPWQFNEPFPNNFCTAAVDYHARPKPAYHTVARTYAPVALTARFESMSWEGRDAFAASLWIAATRSMSEGGTVIARLVDVAGVERARQEFEVGPLEASAREIGLFQASLESVGEVFFLDLALRSGAATVTANRYPFVRTATLAPLLSLPLAQLDVTVNRHPEGWNLLVTNPGAVAAVACWLDDALDLGSSGYAYFSDNYFTLLPGESRAIEVEWSDVVERDRALTFSAFNLPERVLR